MTSAGHIEITRAYRAQADAAADIRAAVRSAAIVDVMAVRGLGILGLKDSLVREVIPVETRLRVLLLDPDSAAVSYRAQEIGESGESFSAGIRLSLSRLRELAAAERPIEVYLYDHVPVWRIISIAGSLGHAESCSSPPSPITAKPIFAQPSRSSRNPAESCTAPFAELWNRPSLPHTASCDQRQKGSAVIETEYKARLTDPDRVRAALHERATPDVVSYRDTYYDTPNGDLDRVGREFRLRTVEDSSGGRRHVLTFKDSAVDEATGSKPEFETRVADPDAMGDIIIRLGYQPVLSFTKRCENFEFTAFGRAMVGTIARVPEIDGTFLELESQAEESDLTQAFTDLKAVLTELGVTSEELTTALDTDAVRQARH